MFRLAALRYLVFAQVGMISLDFGEQHAGHAALLQPQQSDTSAVDSHVRRAMPEASIAPGQAPSE